MTLPPSPQGQDDRRRTCPHIGTDYTGKCWECGHQVFTRTDDDAPATVKPSLTVAPDAPPPGGGGDVVEQAAKLLGVPEYRVRIMRDVERCVEECKLAGRAPGAGDVAMLELVRTLAARVVADAGVVAALRDTFDMINAACDAAGIAKDRDAGGEMPKPYTPGERLARLVVVSHIAASERDSWERQAQQARQDLAARDATMAQLRGVVDRLPKTADGVPTAPPANEQ